jgi:AraC-like DNA-binding protein
VICQRILPCLDLRYFIREYLVAHFIFTDHSKLPPVRTYPANPEEAIRLILRGRLYSSDFESGRTIETPTISLIGQPTIRQNLQITHDYLMVYIRFQPGSLFKLLGIPMTKLTDQHVEANIVIKDIGELYEQLGDFDTDYAAMVRRLDDYFLKKLRDLEYNKHPIDNVGRIILNNPQSFNLEKTAKDACLSFRQFEKRFQQQVGITPKYYARVCRFYEAFQLKECNPELDWLSVAVRTGYSDYQHLTKDFKEFSNTTPTIFLRQSMDSPSNSFESSSHFRGV